MGNGPDRRSGDHGIRKWLPGVIVTISIFLSSTAVGWVVYMERRMTTMESKQQKDLDQDNRMLKIENNVDALEIGMKLDLNNLETKMDTQLRESRRRFWRLHGWARDRINEGRVARGEAIASWPELDN